MRLHVLASSAAEDAHLEFEVDSDGRVGEGVVRAEGKAFLGLGHDAEGPRVLQGVSGDECASAAGWTVWIERDFGLTRLVVRGPTTGRVVAWEAFAIAAAPALAVVEGGAWIAFHHDLREDTGEPDVVKWIAVRFVDREGRVFEAAAEMTGRCRDAAGEEQGYEFPSLAVGPEGAVAIFGRGSHRFWRQDLSGAGYSPRVALGEDGEWGCRGRRVAVCSRGAGLLTARRERRGIVLESFDAPEGGPVALRPATAVVVDRASARPRRDAPRRPEGPDPATRWGRSTLFGDIHQHSAHSDGCGSAVEPYLRARWGYGDDFCALSDHESFLGKRLGAGEWAYLQEVAESQNDPGQFVTLQAYEWTAKKHPGPGHKVVYLPGPGQAIVSRDRVPEGRALLDAVSAQGGFAVPHHVGWTGADEASHDPHSQPVWEICSCHGCYLSQGHPLGSRGDLRDQMVEDVLRRGQRFGFIACSDGHGLLWHHGVARKRDPFRTGLTAVQAEARTRPAILAALRARRCYATSGVPILLDVCADGVYPMGSAIEAREAVHVVARARGTARIRECSLVTEEGVIAAAGGATDVVVEGRLERGWCYARVVQEDGEMAWSSPIFVDRISVEASSPSFPSR